MFVTHYPLLSRLADELAGVANYHMAFVEEDEQEQKGGRRGEGIRGDGMEGEKEREGQEGGGDGGRVPGREGGERKKTDSESTSLDMAVTVLAPVSV